MGFFHVGIEERDDAAVKYLQREGACLLDRVHELLVKIHINDREAVLGNPDRMVPDPLDDAAEHVIVHCHARGDPHLPGERCVLQDHVGLPGDQPVEPVRVRVPVDHVHGKRPVVGLERGYRVLVHVLDDHKHPLEGIVKGHLRGIEEILDRDDGLGLLHHFLADRHLGEVPDNRADKRGKPLLCGDADHGEPGDVGTDQHAEEERRIGNRAAVDLLDPLYRHLR